MNHHTLAAVSIAGSCLDVLGSLYLAYDLLGGQHGPLRLLTRAVTYSILCGVGYGLGLGVFFGVAAGVAIGITVSIELSRESRGLQHYSLSWEGVFAAIRALGVGAGLYRLVGLSFAAAFGVLITLGQVFAYSRGIRPGMDYSAARHARFSRRMFWSTLARTAGYIVTALLCSALVHRVEHPLEFALRIGVVTGIVTSVFQLFYPFIEGFADQLPQRWLGAFGIGLIFCGFLLQSLQYWLALLDVPIS